MKIPKIDKPVGIETKKPKIKMIKKIAILARDRPIYFFMAGFIFLSALLFIATSVLALILKYSPTKPDGPFEILLVAILFTPIFPIFFSLFLLLVERYLNFFKVGWIIGLKENPFLRLFLRWAGVDTDEVGVVDDK